MTIRLARDLGTEIVSADSRQIFRDIPIGTAAPTSDELAAVRHHFVGILGLDEYYSAAQFEEDALAVIGRLFLTHDYVVMCGGSMMYVDAVCKGIDQLPTISDDSTSPLKIAVCWRRMNPDISQKSQFIRIGQERKPVREKP